MNNYQNIGQYSFTSEALSLAGEARLAYIRKVYNYFALAIGAGIGGVLISINTGVVGFFANSPLIGFLLLMGAIIFAGRSAENPSTALPTLVLAAFLSGMIASPLVYFAGTQGLDAVYSAALLSGVVFGGLTLYTWVSRKDFSYMGASLMIGLFLLIGVGLVNYLFVQSSTLALASAIVSVIVFSGFVLYDTSRILRQPHLIPPTLAALSLYLDFFNLFLAILQIFGIGGSDD